MNKTSSKLNSNASSSPHDGKPGEFGPFRIDSILSDEDEGIVFAATHRRQCNQVTLHVFPPLAGDDLKDFAREMTIAEDMKHPSVARVVDSGSCEGYQYIAFETIEGVDLKSALKRECKFSPSLACAIIRQAAIGLHHIHEHELLHGCVSPKNLMMAKSGVVKIFGLGTAGRTSKPGKTDDSDAARYLAPEQLSDSADTQSDIYGLGCTLYHLLSGEAPPACVDRSANGERFPLARIAPELSPELISVVRSMMAPDKGKRIQQLTQVVGAMCSWASEEEIPGLISRNTKSPAKPKQDPTPTPTPTQVDAAVCAENSTQPPVNEQTTMNSEKTNSPDSSSNPTSSVVLVAGGLAMLVGVVIGSWAVFGGWAPLPSANSNAVARPLLAQDNSTAVAPAVTTQSTTVVNADQPTDPKLELVVPERGGPTLGPETESVAQETPPREATSVSPTDPHVTKELAATGNKQTVVTTQDMPKPSPTEGTVTKEVAVVTSQDIATVRPAQPDVDAYHERVLQQLTTDYGLTEGKWVLTPNELALISSVVSYGQTVTQGVATEKEDFSRFVRMHVDRAGEKPWSTGLFIPDVEKIEKGDRVLVVVWLRTAPGSAASTGKVSIFVEDARGNEKEVYMTVKPTSEWRQFLIPFQSKLAKDLRVGFHLAFKKQDIDYGGLTLINYGKSAPFWAANPKDPKKTEKATQATDEKADKPQPTPTAENSVK